MSTDTRDRLEILKAELDFVEKGGYGRSVRTPWKPTSIFQDSLSCLNHGYSYRAHSCSECLLDDFVPEGSHAAAVPCHHRDCHIAESFRREHADLVTDRDSKAAARVPRASTPVD